MEAASRHCFLSCARRGSLLCRGTIYEATRCPRCSHRTRLPRSRPDLLPKRERCSVGGHLVAQYEYLVRPSIESGTTTLLDSYYYKLLAKERLLGFAHPSLEMLCAELPQPDHVIYISVDPEESLRRKRGVISPYEHFPSTGPSSYVEFQRALGAAMLASLEHIPHVVLDGSLARAELTKLAMISIRELSGQELA